MCMFLVMALCALCPIAAHRGLESESQYHSGHRASHITRLHRYEHTGAESMFEAESRWLERRGTRNHGDDGEAAPKNFVRLSPVQVDALQRHHEAALAVRFKGSSVLETGRRVGRAHRGGKMWPLGDMVNGAVTGLSDFMGWRKGHAKSEPTNASDHKVAAFDVLSQLGSQYVGPIGVGTSQLPVSCGEAEAASLSQTSPQHSGHHLGTDTQRQAADACRVSSESLMFVVFDTGSTNLWVSSDLCTQGPCVKKGRHRYDHARSRTYEQPADGKTIGITFGTGGLSGEQAVDDFRIGPFTIRKQTFGMIKTLNGAVFDEVPIEGILGLAFPAMSANHVRPFFDTVIEEKALEHNEFAFYLSRDDPAANAVLWGGVDPNLFEGKIEYFPVADPYYWSLALHSFRVGDDVLFGEGAPGGNFSLAAIRSGIAQIGEWLHGPGSSASAIEMNASASTTANTAARSWKKQYAIVDTGTTFFSADGELFSEVLRRLPSARCDDINKTSHPDIVFRMPGASGELRDFVLTNEQYMAPSGEGKDRRCTTAFMKLHIPEAHGPAMVLGEVFLRHYFAVFDRGDGSEGRGRIGFAKSLHTDEAKGHLRTATTSQPSFLTERVTQQRAGQLRGTDGDVANA